MTTHHRPLQTAGTGFSTSIFRCWPTVSGRRAPRRYRSTGTDSSLTAIRSAGDAITVDYRSLTRPYRVEAIGDPRTLQARFVESSAGAWWNDLAQNRRMRYEISDVKQLDLAADPGMVLRHAGRRHRDPVAGPARRDRPRHRAGAIDSPSAPAVPSDRHRRRDGRPVRCVPGVPGGQLHRPGLRCVVHLQCLDRCRDRLCG